MKIRQMTTNDLEFALEMTAREGWNNTRLDFEEILRFNPNGSFIGEIAGEPVGMVCTTNYGRFSFLGNLIVVQKFRGRNYGRILMEFAMSFLEKQGNHSILLDAVSKAIPFYERLGFRKVSKSLRLEGNVIGKSTEYVRPMSLGDLDEIIELDATQFGGHREGFVRMRFTAFPDLCFILECDEEIHGYIMGSKSGSSIRIGPWVMKSHIPESEDLLLALAQSSSSTSLMIGVLANSTNVLQLLKKYGFIQTSYSWRMAYGKDTEATLSSHLYAICCPARG